MEITGYRRPDGQVGIRNTVAIIYSVLCSKFVAQKIAAKFEGTQVFGRRNGCHEDRSLYEKMVALGRHPNVAAVLVVGLGCERNEAPALAKDIARSGKPVEFLEITKEGGTMKTVEAGSRLLEKLISQLNDVPRISIPVSELVVGMDCAGSDATSGLASNPALGVASDLLVEAGATVYCFNVDQELIGMENEYRQRAINQRTAETLCGIIPQMNAPVPSLGNIKGGITNAREKAIGAFAKAGSSPILGVVDSFRRPEKHGLYLEIMVPGSFEDYSDPQCAMQMAACGAHIVIETTGIGTVTGGVVAPVIKVCANPKTISIMGDDMDVDASGIMTGEKTVGETGRKIYEEIIAVAAGKLTRSEELGHFED